MNQPVDGPKMYNSLSDCFVKVSFTLLSRIKKVFTEKKFGEVYTQQLCLYTKDGVRAHTHARFFLFHALTSLIGGSRTRGLFSLVRIHPDVEPNCARICPSALSLRKDNGVNRREVNLRKMIQAFMYIPCIFIQILL